MKLLSQVVNTRSNYLKMISLLELKNGKKFIMKLKQQNPKLMIQKSRLNLTYIENFVAKSAALALEKTKGNFITKKNSVAF